MKKMRHVPIAERVVARILASAQRHDAALSPTAPDVAQPAMPAAADGVSVLGAQLDTALSTPPPAVPLPENAEPGMAAAALNGDSMALESALQGIAEYDQGHANG